MRAVVILGAGVVGMTTAYALARKGFAVTVIDAAGAPGEGGASFGNGAQLSYSYTDAMASPSMTSNLPKYLLGRDSAVRIKLTPSPAFLAWGMRFLANASQRRFEGNTIEIFKLAMESREEFAALSGKMEFRHRATGKLNLYCTTEMLRNAEILSRLKNRYGAQQELLTPEQAVGREPALRSYGYPLVGALWSPLDEAGDCHMLCLKLRELLQNQYGVEFQFNTRIKRLRKQAGRVKAIVTNKSEISCSRAVLALGAHTAAIASTVGIACPSGRFKAIQ